jgi:hypothetical protein
MRTPRLHAARSTFACGYSRAGSIVRGRSSTGLRNDTTAMIEAISSIAAPRTTFTKGFDYLEVIELQTSCG